MGPSLANCDCNLNGSKKQNSIDNIVPIKTVLLKISAKTV